MLSERFRFGVVVAAFALSLGAVSSRLFAEEPKALFVDEFDGKAKPEWNPVRPDPDLVSFTSHPGKLTVTTQLGAIGGDIRRRRTPLTKNLFMVANPNQDKGDFVVTTCVESFHPTMKYQQAGLLIYDDDDNYLKFDLESNGSAPGFKHIREQDTFRLIDTDPKIEPADRIWFRLVKRGNVYERAYSTDGKTFEVFGEAVWGDGSPQQVGLVACNGPMDAKKIEAQFDYFRIRELTAKEREDAGYQQRQKLAGVWEVVNTRASGKELAESPITEFNFDGGNVSFVIQGEATEVDYLLNVDSEPKGFTMSSLTVGAKEPVNGNYSIDDDQLILCLSLPPGAPAPKKLETLENDGRILLTLQRAD